MIYIFISLLLQCQHPFNFPCLFICWSSHIRQIKSRRWEPLLSANLRSHPPPVAALNILVLLIQAAEYKKAISSKVINVLLTKSSDEPKLICHSKHSYLALFRYIIISVKPIHTISQMLSAAVISSCSYWYIKPHIFGNIQTTSRKCFYSFNSYYDIDFSVNSKLVHDYLSISVFFQVHFLFSYLLYF